MYALASWMEIKIVDWICASLIRQQIFMETELIQTEWGKHIEEY